MSQVDAFSDQVFAGNPAAVLILDDWLPVDLMQSIAQENNLAETAFARPRTDGAWDLRWFTPVHEAEFCGHATMATAHVLRTNHGVEDTLVFHTRVGELKVSALPNAYRLDIPCLQPSPLEALPQEIAGIFTNPPVQAFRNFENLFVDLGSADAVRQFVPDFEKIALLDPLGLVVTGREEECGNADFVSRYFAPASGIPEDPVTGSIHATLVPYWADKFSRNQLMAHQVSPRGGWLDCELSGDRVFLTGKAVTFMEATIFIPGLSQ